MAATLCLRCPRCLEGAVYRGLMRMHPQCPACSYRFEREEGYFYGAMYTSWALMMVTVIPAMIVLLFVSRDPLLITGVLGLQVLLQAPIAYMYSRVIWMHIDLHFDPAAASTRPQHR